MAIVPVKSRHATPYVVPSALNKRDATCDSLPLTIIIPAVRLTAHMQSPPDDHFRPRLNHRAIGVIYHTDIYGDLIVAIDEPTPLPSAVTRLPNLLGICV